MADLGFTFNPEEVKDDFEALPAGVYQIECVKDEWQDAKSGAKMLVATFKVTKGEHTGKQILHRFMPDHPNETAAKIARVALKRWAEAVGHVGLLKNTGVLHFKPFEAELVVTKREHDGREYIGNEIKRWGAPRREAAPAPEPNALPWQA
jgi:hypothetical protein